MKNYKMAIIGFGGMANWHRKLLSGEGYWSCSKISEIPRLSIKGTFDILEERQQAARDLGLHAYDSLEAALADPEIDLILCATPNDVHQGVVIRALEAGKNVICEKPAALGSGELREMADASAKSGKLFTVHQNRRWDDDFVCMKRIYNDELLGPVFKIESRVHGSRGIPGDWRGRPEHGGGMILDWGVHILDQALQMIPGKITHVYATVTHVTNELVDDGFTAELTFDSGLRYLCEVGTSNFIGLPRWVMLGRDGSAIIRDWNLDGEIVRVTDWTKNDAVPIVTAAGLTKTMAPRTDETICKEPLPAVSCDISEFYNNVVAVMDGEADPIVKISEVMRVMKLMETIRASAETGQALEFE